MNNIYSRRGVLYSIVLIRILVPFVVFASPLFAYILSLFFDQMDGQIFYENKIKWKYYNAADKILDYWWYLFILSYLFINQHDILNIATFLFFFRSIGQFIGVVFKKESIYIFFPNVFEPFSMLSIITTFDTNLLLLVCVCYAILMEWVIHHSHIKMISKHILKREIKWKK